MSNIPLNAPHAQAISRSNVNASSHFNELLGVLEGAEGSLVLRQRIFEELTNLLNAYNIQINNGQGNNPAQPDLSKIQTIRLAVSYVASLLGDIAGANEIERNNKVISHLENTVLKNSDLSESAIIRLSALNRFQVELSAEEMVKLNKIESELNGKLTTSVPSMINSSGNRGETNAQRIQRVIEIVNYLAKNGVLTEFPEGYKELAAKLDPLRALDTKYHELNQARNTFYDIQNGHGEVQVLNQTQTKKLEVALNTLTGCNLEAYFEKHIRGKLSGVNLHGLLDSIKSSNPDIGGKIKSLNLSVNDFERYFLFHFSTTILKKVKTEFEMKKSEVFVDRRRDFEGDLQTWRAIQRNRVIELSQDAVGNLQVLNDIFSRDRKVFIRTGNAQGDALIENGLRVVINYRYPVVPQATRDQLVNAILDENEATNRLYYGSDTTLFDDMNDIGRQGFLKATGNAGRNIQKVAEYTTPVLNIFVKMMKAGVEAVGGKLGEVITSTAKGVHDGLGKYNEWANKGGTGFFGSIGKFPFYASQVITRPLRMVTGATNIIAKEGVGMVSGTYNGINGFLKNAGNKEIESMFDLVTQAYRHSVRLLGKGTEWSGDKGFDVLKTRQKREILAEFYNTRTEKEVAELFQSIDISSRLDDSSPYVFDKDAFDDFGFEIVKKAANNNVKSVGAKMKYLMEQLEGDDIEWTNKAIGKGLKKILKAIKSKVDAGSPEKEVLSSLRAQFTKFVGLIKSDFETTIERIGDNNGGLRKDLADKNAQITATIAQPQNQGNNQRGGQKVDITPLQAEASKIRDEIKVESEKLAELSGLGCELDANNNINLRQGSLLSLLDELASNIDNAGIPLAANNNNANNIGFEEALLALEL